MKKAYGFTIVELLIVIVVVAILAVISIVAYNGVSNSANDSTIRSDLANMAKKAAIYHAEQGQYPSRSLAFSNSYGAFATKSAYDTTVYNLYYCTNTDRSHFGIASRSKSGKTFVVSSTTGVVQVTTNPSWNTACGAFGETVLGNVLFDYGYNLGTQTWKSGLAD